MVAHIAILLSTYNSSAYLKEQIDSILLQSYKKWDLFIRDDGSTDNTLEILLEYSNKYSNIHVVEDTYRGLGPRDSFLYLLQYVNAEYYMFCDHDDVWLPCKIEETLNRMKATLLKHPSALILVCSDLCVVDNELNVISDSLWRLCKVKPNVLCRNYKYLSVCNFVTGCTVMINHLVKDNLFPYPPMAPMHDYYIALRVAELGIIEYISKPLLLYRQHGTNSIGAEAYPKFVIIKKICSFYHFMQVNKRLYNSVSSVIHISVLEYWFYKLIYFLRR